MLAPDGDLTDLIRYVSAHSNAAVSHRAGAGHHAQYCALKLELCLKGCDTVCVLTCRLSPCRMAQRLSTWRPIAARQPLSSCS